MVSALDSGSKGSGSSPGRVIVLCSWATETLYSHSAFLHPEIQMGTNDLSGNLTKYLEVTCDGLESHPGGVAILLFTSCYENRDKLRQCWPLGLSADFFHSTSEYKINHFSISFSKQELKLFLKAVTRTRDFFSTPCTCVRNSLKVFRYSFLSAIPNIFKRHFSRLSSVGST